MAFADLDARGELEGALELCRGELLPELDDDWVLEARGLHAAVLVDVLARLASERDARGDLKAAISLSRRMAAIDALGEAPIRELMRRLAAAGERGSAIEAYQRLAERLQRQLRLAPSAATRVLADQLRAPESAGVAPSRSEDLSTTFELAVPHYQQELKRAPRLGKDTARRGELLLGLGGAKARAGRTSEARQACEEASEVARHLGDPRLLARAVLGLAGIGVTILDVDETLTAQLSDALEMLPEAESALRAELMARLAIARAYSPDRQESARIAEQAVEIARSCDEPATLARAHSAQHVALEAPDVLEQRLATASAMLELAGRAADRECALLARNFRATDILEPGDVSGCDRELESYAALYPEFPLPAFRWYVPLWRATRATINGDFDEAARLAARARQEGRQAGDENAVRRTPAGHELDRGDRRAHRSMPALERRRPSRGPLSAAPPVHWPDRHVRAWSTSLRARRLLPRVSRANDGTIQRRPRLPLRRARAQRVARCPRLDARCPATPQPLALRCACQR